MISNIMKKYDQGHTSRTWDDSFKELEYQYLPRADHAMIQEWQEWVLQGYSADLTLNGEIHRLGSKVPEYMQPLCDQLGWKDQIRLNFRRLFQYH